MYRRDSKKTVECPKKVGVMDTFENMETCINLRVENPVEGLFQNSRVSFMLKEGRDEIMVNYR